MLKTFQANYEIDGTLYAWFI